MYLFTENEEKFYELVFWEGGNMDNLNDRMPVARQYFESSRGINCQGKALILA